MKKFLTLSLVLSLMALVSCGGGSATNLPGVDGPHLHVQDGKVQLDVELENVFLTGELTFEVPQIPNSSFKLTTGDKGGLELQGVLDYSDIVSGDFPTAEPTTLPGNRPFPGLGTPELYSFEVPNNKGSFIYANKNIFAVYMPLGYDSPVGLRTEIEAAGKNYGFAALLPNDANGENSGLVVVLQLNKRNKRLLKKLLRHSKRNPNRLY